MRLTKHNFPFIPPHCGVHIAQSRGTIPDHPAQMLFDLLNHRNFALPRPTGTSSKALFLNMGWHLHNNDANLFQPVRKEGGARNRLLFHKKRGACLLWTTWFWLLPFVSCPTPHAANPRVYGALYAARGGLYRRESGSFVERKTKLPTSLRKT